MCYYFIAQVRIKDEIEYQKYIDRSEDVFKKYKGKYLSVDNSPQILEGKWKYSRTVIIRFDSVNEFNDWYNSSEYQKILKYRLNAADCDTILVKGLN